MTKPIKRITPLIEQVIHTPTDLKLAICPNKIGFIDSKGNHYEMIDETPGTFEQGILVGIVTLEQGYDIVEEAFKAIEDDYILEIMFTNGSQKFNTKE